MSAQPGSSAATSALASAYCSRTSGSRSGVVATRSCRWPRSGGRRLARQRPRRLAAGAVRDVLPRGRAPPPEGPAPPARSARTASRRGAAADQQDPTRVDPRGPTSASSPSASPQSIPSTAARARWAGVEVARVSPSQRARSRRAGSASARPPGRGPAPGRPRRAGPRAPGRTAASWSTPSSRAAASSTRAAFSVHTSGRNRPVASAKPATMPVGVARLGRSATAVTTPDVPIETTTSPGPAPSPSAAAALSPAPAPSDCSGGRRPGACRAGRAPAAARLRRPRARSQQVGPVAARRRRTSSRCRWRRCGRWSASPRSVAAR